MTHSSYNADSLIDEIDAGRLVPKRHAVIRALQANMQIDDNLERELIALHDARSSIDIDEWSRRIWSKISELPLVDQGSLRLCVGLLQPDDDLDWHEAEYFIMWAREKSCSDEQIKNAFHAANRGS